MTIIKDIGSKTIRSVNLKTHGGSTLKEVSHVDETTTLGKFKDVITKDIEEFLLTVIEYKYKL